MQKGKIFTKSENPLFRTDFSALFEKNSQYLKLYKSYRTKAVITTIRTQQQERMSLRAFALIFTPTELFRIYYEARYYLR